jgi:hypothetical protein
MSIAERFGRRVPAPWRRRCWWYPALFVLSVLYLSVVAQVLAPFVPSAVVPVTKLLAVVAGVVYLFDVPLLTVFLFVDACGAIVDGDSWQPNPYLYGLLGATPVISFSDLPYAVVGSVVAFVVCVVYLVQRHRHLGTP